MPHFDPRTLGFDADDMLRGLQDWVECESPTWDSAAVNRMMDIAAYELAVLGAKTERVAGTKGFADTVIGRFPHPLQGEPGILVLGHLDTVHPLGTLARLPFRREGDICFGPGICDMKAGNYLSLEAIRQLQRAGIASPLPVTVMFTGDEEAGSPSTRALIEAEARRHRYVLVPEPARPDGTIALGRHGISRFTLTVTGKPTHAGNTPERGVSAVREMAELLVAIEEMSTADATCSVGVIHGGQWSNCVPTTCSAEALVISKTQAALEAIRAQLGSLQATRAGARFVVKPGPERPQWSPDAACLALHAHAATIARTLSFPLSHTVSGGGSDGNFTGALGIPTLDGLGARGQLHHTLEEHIFVDSLVERGRLMAGLLGSLA